LAAAARRAADPFFLLLAILAFTLIRALQGIHLGLGLDFFLHANVDFESLRGNSEFRELLRPKG
jgi:hypothetical protein